MRNIPCNLSRIIHAIFSFFPPQPRISLCGNVGDTLILPPWHASGKNIPLCAMSIIINQGTALKKLIFDNHDSFYRASDRISLFLLCHSTLRIDSTDYTSNVSRLSSISFNSSLGYRISCMRDGTLGIWLYLSLFRSDTNLGYLWFGVHMCPTICYSYHNWITSSVNWINLLEVSPAEDKQRNESYRMENFYRH